MGQQKHSLVEEIAQQVSHKAVSLLLSSLFNTQVRFRRQSSSGMPTPHGDYLFTGDNAPINCLPHLPHLGQRWESGRGYAKKIWPEGWGK